MPPRRRAQPPSKYRRPCLLRVRAAVLVAGRREARADADRRRDRPTRVVGSLPVQPPHQCHAAHPTTEIPRATVGRWGGCVRPAGAGGAGRAWMERKPAAGARVRTKASLGGVLVLTERQRPSELSPLPGIAARCAPGSGAPAGWQRDKLSTRAGLRHTARAFSGCRSDRRS